MVSVRSNFQNKLEDISVSQDSRKMLRERSNTAGIHSVGLSVQWPSFAEMRSTVTGGYQRSQQLGEYTNASCEKHTDRFGSL